MVGHTFWNHIPAKKFNTLIPFRFHPIRSQLFMNVCWKFISFPKYQNFTTINFERAILFSLKWCLVLEWVGAPVLCLMNFPLLLSNKTESLWQIETKSVSDNNLVLSTFFRQCYQGSLSTNIVLNKRWIYFHKKPFKCENNLELT